MVDRCPHCGAPLPPERNFCLACGRPRRAESIAVPVPRRTRRLWLPCLILAALLACSPLLPLLRPAADTVKTDTSDATSALPADADGETGVHPPEYGLPAQDKENETAPDDGKTDSSAAPSDSSAATTSAPLLPAVSQPTVSQPTTPQPAAQTPSGSSTPSPSTPESEDPQPSQTEHSSVMDSAETLDYWLEHGEPFDAAEIFEPGVIYYTYDSVSRDKGGPNWGFARLGYDGVLHVGVLCYHRASADGGERCDADSTFDFSLYGDECHLTDYYVESFVPECRRVPNTDGGRTLHAFLHLGGGVIVDWIPPETYLVRHLYGPSEGSWILQGWQNETLFLNYTQWPGIAAAAEYALDG